MKLRTANKRGVLLSSHEMDPGHLAESLNVSESVSNFVVPVDIFDSVMISQVIPIQSCKKLATITHRLLVTHVVA